MSIETFTQEAKQTCKTMKGLFSVLGKKFKPCYSHKIISLQYQKLQSKSNEFAQKRMGRL